MAYDSECWSPSDELLDRFIAEQTAPDERVAVELWLARMPVAQRTVHAIRQLHFDTPLSDAEHKGLWQRVEWRLGEGVVMHSTGRRRGVETTRRWTGWYVMSGLALSAMLLLVGWGVGTHGTLSPTARAPITYSTGRGERANIRLPDGSTVVLNVASRLDVPADYISGNHTLRLTGEALFDVVHSKDVPFTVWAGTTSVRVLGTTFLVRRYTSDRQTKVVVRSGKVAVGSIVLTGGRLIEVGDGKNWHTGPADPAPFSFVMGTLTLAEMSLAQAIPELDRWYDADIRLGDSTLGERHIVGEFRAGSLADVQAILTMTFNVRVVRDGRTLTIFQK